MERFKHLIVDPRLAVQYPELWADSDATHKASYLETAYADFLLALLLITKQQENPIAENMHLSLTGVMHFDAADWDLGAELGMRSLTPEIRRKNKIRAIEILADFTTRMERDDDGFYCCANGLCLHTYTGAGELGTIITSLPETEWKYPNLILSLTRDIRQQICRVADRCLADIRDKREEVKKLRENDEEAKAADLEGAIKTLEEMRDAKLAELDGVVILTNDPATIVLANQNYYKHVGMSAIRNMLGVDEPSEDREEATPESAE